MTPDLRYLVLSALLCLLLWVPYIVALIRTRGNNPDDYRDPPGPNHSAFLKRANRAHLNLVENLAIFAVLVLVVHLTDGATEGTALASAAFFWSRVAHAVVFWAGWPYVRTLVFSIGWIANLYLAYVLLS